MAKHYIVVEDPEGTYYEGSLVDPLRAAKLTARGAVLLPVEPELFRLSGVGGYSKRAWGAGWPLDSVHPLAVAQLLLLCDPEHPGLHWCARLSRSDAAQASEGHVVQGSLRIAADTSQRTPHNLRLIPGDSPIDAGKLGKPDARGGWTVRGRATLQCASQGHYGLALYGMAPGLRVLWAAVSCTTDK